MCYETFNYQPIMNTTSNKATPRITAGSSSWSKNSPASKELEISSNRSQGSTWILINTHNINLYFLSQQWSGWWLMLGTLSALHCTQQECQFRIASHFWQHCGNTWLWHSAHTNHFHTCFRISVWSLLGSWTQNTFSCLSIFLPPTGQIRMVL